MFSVALTLHFYRITKHIHKYTHRVQLYGTMYMHICMHVLYMHIRMCAYRHIHIRGIVLSGGLLTAGRGYFVASQGLLRRRPERMSCGDFHSAVVTSGGELYTWGYGRAGRLGHGSEDDVLCPARVRAPTEQNNGQVSALRVLARGRA